MKQFYFKMIKIPRLAIFLGILFLLASQGVFATGTFTTTTTGGNWSDPTTWVNGIAPPAVTNTSDIIIINGDVTLTLNTSNTVYSAGTSAPWKRQTFSIGAITIAAGKTLTVTAPDGSASTGTSLATAIAGYGYYLTLGSSTVASTISGNLFFDNTIYGGKTICELRVDATGSLVETNKVSLSIANAKTITNYGTITTGTLSPGTTPGIFSNYGTINSTGFTSSSTGTFNNYAGAVLNVNGTIAGTIKNYGTINSNSFSGSATTSNVINYSSGVINFTGGSMTATNLVLNVSDPGNTVNYSLAGSQTIKDVAYSNLILSNSGTKTIGTAASGTLCSGTLSISGTAAASITNTGVGVGKLIVGGVGKIAGTYGGSSSTAPIKINTILTGAGNFIVSGSVPNWTGATGNWSTTTNWSTGAAPATGDIITIASGNPVLDTDFTVGSGGSLLLSGTGGLTVAPTATLSVTGTADFGGLPVTFKSDASGTARFGKLLGTLTGATNVTVERFIPARRAFRLLSSPITTTITGSTTIFDNWQEGINTVPGLGTHITGTGGSINGFNDTATNAPSLFTHDNANQAWVAVTNTSTNILTAGTPYLIMVRGDKTTDLSDNAAAASNTTLRAKGTLKTGTVAVSGLSTAADGFSLIGNPYQSTVDMQATLAAATNLKNSYFVWDPTLGTRGAYVTRDLSGSGANNIASNVDNYLQPGQACFVQTSSTPTATPTLSFTEAYKSTTTATNQGVMRAVAPINATATKASTSASIRLTLFNKTALANQGTPTDGAVVLFNEASSNEVDANDCSKMTNLDENLAFNTKGNLLSIEHRAVPTAADEIQLAITQYRAKDYTLVAQGTNVDGVTAYLVDQYTKTSTALPASGSINYNFTVDPSNANSSAANRFKIIFQDATSATEFTENEVKVYPNPSTGGMVTISLPFIQQESKVSILNFAGETIYSTTIAAGENAAINPNKSLAIGIYFVKMEQAGKTVTKKLIIK